jgi:hypothetical protein
MRAFTLQLFPHRDFQLLFSKSGCISRMNPRNYAKKLRIIFPFLREKPKNEFEGKWKDFNGC